MWRARWSRWDLISHSLIRTQRSPKKLVPAQASYESAHQAGQVPWSQSQLSPGLQTPGDGDVPSYWPSHETQAFGDLESKQHLSFSPL